ncbi:MAG: undecaprenyl-phosphate glucose phosphotransferase [Gammaproteobacteria bacterium]|nr:undecaprenyl-phosphate glucose phosphotransferase [Gammaproteobacteria bacterium]
MVLDVALVLGTLAFLVYQRFGTMLPQYRHLAILTVLVLWVVYNNNEMYSRMRGFADTIFALLKSWFTVCGLLLIVGFLFRETGGYARGVLGWWVIVATAGQCTVHAGSYFLRRRLVRTRARRPAIVVGAGKLAVELVNRINNNAWMTDRAIGIVDDDDAELAAWAFEGVPALGRTEALHELIDRHGAEAVYLALPIAESHKIEQIYLSLLDKPINIVWAPDIFGFTLINHNVKEVGGVPLIALSETPLVGAPAMLKDLMDKTLALLAIIGLSPLLATIALIVKYTSEGPILFKQKRHGWDGKIIEVWKFRSMYTKQPKVEGDIGVQQATKHDPRITPIGRFIRRSSIDELPQLFNVLQGTMSLVGPRPHAVEHNNYYAHKIDAYMLRHRIKPGITGLAQANGYRGETETLDKMQKRVEYDIAYINNWSLWLDIKIMVKTVFTLLNKNAY